MDSTRLSLALGLILLAACGRSKDADDFSAMQARGEHVMGVNQYTSAHVFEDLPDGGRVVVYEAREAPKIEPEPSMPGADEYFPNVEIEQKKSLDEVGEHNICFETDYPHTDTTWPNSKEYVEKMVADLDEDVAYKVLRGNAIRMLELDRV